MGVALALAITAAVALGLAWFDERRNRQAELHHAARASRGRDEQIQNWKTQARVLEAASGASADLLLAVDASSVVLYANPAAQSSFGSPSGMETLITYTGSPQAGELARDALATADEAGIERIVRIGGHPFRARARRSEFGVGLWLQDVTELQRLTLARQDLIDNLSHELRTPLSALRLLAETLQAPAGQDPETAKTLAGHMTEEVDTLHQMAQEMLELSAIESGRQPFRLVPLALRDIVLPTLERMQRELGRKSLHLDVGVPEDLQILGDRVQAERAVQNVLHNAMKFSAEGGRIRIEGQATAPGEVVLRISDEGPGIHPADLARIFERFYRGDRARGTPGTGLGLAIAHHVMRAHGGRIWAENRKPPGRGATFTLLFPSLNRASSSSPVGAV